MKIKQCKRVGTETRHCFITVVRGGCLREVLFTPKHGQCPKGPGVDLVGGGFGKQHSIWRSVLESAWLV